MQQLTHFTQVSSGIIFHRVYDLPVKLLHRTAWARKRALPHSNRRRITSQAHLLSSFLQRLVTLIIENHLEPFASKVNNRDHSFKLSDSGEDLRLPLLVIHLNIGAGHVE